MHKHNKLVRKEGERVQYEERMPPRRKYGTEVTPALLELYADPKGTNKHDKKKGGAASKHKKKEADASKG